MEHFFQYDYTSQGETETLWFDENGVFPVNQSAFVSYTDRPIEGFPRKNQNINKRMMEVLMRRSKSLMMETEQQPERGRCHRHMISERMRREKQKQSYLTLHSMLPFGTKSDKNSIVQMAAKKIEELERRKMELQRRKREIEAALGGGARKVETAKIKLRVAYPSSGTDSVLEVLKCLKETGSKTTAIQSNISPEEISALLEIETKIAAEEVENAVYRRLFEVERKFRSHFQD